MTIDLPTPAQPLRIGTRGSPLALAQAHETRDRLMAAHGLPEAAFAIEVIRTSGDRIQDRPLSEVGGKGLFTREIEIALVEGAIDIAVHSMKDMPTFQPEGLGIIACLPRADVRDAFITLDGTAIDALPQGATVGTSSLRRRAQLRHLRPDLHVVEFRGNVQTRLAKLREGIAAATFLAMAGLERLGLGPEVRRVPLDTAAMLPAVAQGAIGSEARLGDSRAAALLAAIADADTGTRLAAERAFLAGLDGSCQTPIAGLAELSDDGRHLRLRGEILRPDGSERLTGTLEGAAADGPAMGAALAAELRGRAGAGFFDWG